MPCPDTTISEMPSTSPDPMQQIAGALLDQSLTRGPATTNVSGNPTHKARKRTPHEDRRGDEMPKWQSKGRGGGGPGRPTSISRAPIWMCVSPQAPRAGTWPLGMNTAGIRLFYCYEAAAGREAASGVRRPASGFPSGDLCSVHG